MMSSKNLFALNISRLIASPGSLALSILPCSIGSRGARLNGFQASCAQAGPARTEPSTPAHIQWAGRRGACRRGRFDGKPTSSTQCTSCMFGIDLPTHDLKSVNRFFESIECSVTSCAPDSICGVLNLRFGYSERPNSGASHFQSFLIMAQRVPPNLCSRRNRHLSRLYFSLGCGVLAHHRNDQRNGSLPIIPWHR